MFPKRRTNSRSKSRSRSRSRQRRRRRHSSTSSSSTARASPGAEFKKDDLRKILITCSVQQSVADPVVRRDLNPAIVTVVRRPGEGIRPIFDREILRRAPEVSDERRIVKKSTSRSVSKSPVKSPPRAVRRRAAEVTDDRRVIERSSSRSVSNSPVRSAPRLTRRISGSSRSSHSSHHSRSRGRSRSRSRSRSSSRTRRRSRLTDRRASNTRRRERSRSASSGRLRRRRRLIDRRYLRPRHPSRSRRSRSPRRSRRSRSRESRPPHYAYGIPQMLPFPVQPTMRQMIPPHFWPIYQPRAPLPPRRAYLSPAAAAEIPPRPRGMFRSRLPFPYRYPMRPDAPCTMAAVPPESEYTAHDSQQNAPEHQSSNQTEAADENKAT